MGRNHDKLDKARWRVVRLAALERDGYRCTRCGRAGRLEVDHHIPIARGGAKHDLANLQSLCRDCHLTKTAGENSNPRNRAMRAQGRAFWEALMDGA